MFYVGVELLTLVSDQVIVCKDLFSIIYNN